MERLEFEKEWIRATELRDLFPFWSDYTFKQYVAVQKLPIQQTKIAGRWYCRRSDVEAWKEQTNGGTNYNVYAAKVLNAKK